MTIALNRLKLWNIVSFFPKIILIILCEYIYIYIYIYILFRPQQPTKGKARKKQQKTKFQQAYAEKQAQEKKGGQKIFKSKEEIQDFRYSPDGKYLACASRDNYYMYSTF